MNNFIFNNNMSCLMDKIKEQIQVLITQGERLKPQILGNDWLKSQKLVILDKYKSSNPGNNMTLDLMSGGIVGLASNLLGVRKKNAKSMTKNILKNNLQKQKQKEIDALKSQFDNHNHNIKFQYNSWFNEIKRISSTKGFETINHQILESHHKVKLETKLIHGINGLKRMVDQIDKNQQISSNTPLLIKYGEPLKGKDEILSFLNQSKIYLKIQEPYPSKELLRLIEEINQNYGNLKIQLLIGKFGKNQKEVFKQELSILRKTGKNIEVVSVTGENSSPFHDRFIINEKSCISTGTSINGLGLRDSTIHYLDNWDSIEERFDEYFYKNEIILNGKKCKIERL